MVPKDTKPHIILIALFTATLAAVLVTSKPSMLGDSPVRTELPMQTYDWVGSQLFYCHAGGGQSVFSPVSRIGSFLQATVY